MYKRQLSEFALSRRDPQYVGRSKVMRQIERDREAGKALPEEVLNVYAALTKAGVKTDMIVRGICCLIPGIEGYTENIKVVSIVGRFLEHSRIYRFGTKEREKVYLASADFMTRNTIRRVEVAAPVLDDTLRESLDWMFDTMMKDDEKGKELTADGDYVDRDINKEKLDSQEVFYETAYKNAEKK